MPKVKSKIEVNEKLDEELKAIFNGDIPWVTIVWDDPVNLMTYVTYVLMELFGYSKERAHELMMKVHTEGKAVVSTEVVKRWNTMLHDYMSMVCGQLFNAVIKRYDRNAAWFFSTRGQLIFS